MRSANNQEGENTHKKQTRPYRYPGKLVRTTYSNRSFLSGYLVTIIIQATIINLTLQQTEPARTVAVAAAVAANKHTNEKIKPTNSNTMVNGKPPPPFTPITGRGSSESPYRRGGGGGSSNRRRRRVSLPPSLLSSLSLPTTTAGTTTPSTPVSSSGGGIGRVVVGGGGSAGRGIVSAGSRSVSSSGTRSSAGSSSSSSSSTRSSRSSYVTISPHQLPPLPCLLSSPNDESLRRQIENSPSKSHKLRLILDSAMEVMEMNDNIEYDHGYHHDHYDDDCRGYNDRHYHDDNNDSDNAGQIL